MNQPIVLGSYTVLEHLRQSGFTDTYLGEHTIMRTQRVLLRVLRPDASPEFVEAFQAAARRAARLHHNCIASVIDLQRDQDRIFTVLEHVAGRDLDQLRQGPVPPPPEVVAVLMRELFRGLEHAHGQGVWHGRLRPRMVRVDDEGRLKILGFGVQSDGVLVDVSTSVVQREPLYRSPEQVRGEAEDGRTDLYSAGVIFFELLAGRVPFDAPPREDDAPDARVPPPLRAANPFVPAPLAALIEQLLADRREARPASAGAVRLRLEEILEEMGVGSGADLVRRFLLHPEAPVLPLRPPQRQPAKAAPAEEPAAERTIVLPPSAAAPARASDPGVRERPPSDSGVRGPAGTGREPEPEPAKRAAAAPRPASRRGLVLAGAALLVVILAAGAWLATRRAGGGGPGGASGGEPGGVLASLDVSSDPPGASITLVERGETRSANALFERLTPGTYHVRAEFPGAGVRETLITLAAGAAGSLQMALGGAAVAEACTLYVLATPHADEVLVDGRPALGSDSLFWLPTEPGRRRVNVSAEGFVPQRASVEVRPGRHNQLAIALLPAATAAPAPEAPAPVVTPAPPAPPPAEPASGEPLHVEVTPASELWVDHELRQSNVRSADVRLAPGARHVIELRNPDYVTWSKTISVKAGGRLNPIRWDFTQGEGGISVRGGHGDVMVWIDGHATGQSPPAVFRGLKPGRHKVELRSHDGSQVVASQDAIVENSSANQPVVF